MPRASLLSQERFSFKARCCGLSRTAATLLVQANGFLLPGKELRTIIPAKEKTVRFDRKTVEFKDGTVENWTAAALQGKQIQIVGPDSGTGSALTARKILVTFKPLLEK